MAKNPPQVLTQPTTVRINTIMEDPGILITLAGDTPSSDRFSATATLLDMQGQTVDNALLGQRNVSGKWVENDPNVYFLFDEVEIRRLGNCKIQISISHWPTNDSSGMISSRGSVTTQWINVIDADPQGAQIQQPEDNVQQIIDLLNEN